MILINRYNYDLEWLEIHCKKDYPNFKAIKVKEIGGMRDLVKEHLVDTFLDHLTKPEKVKDYIESLNYSKLACYITSKIPTKDKVRKGNFGEIIGSEHLCQRYDYNSPVFKLRYNPNPNTPMHGEDIVVFKILKGKIVGICIGESKTMKNIDHRAVKSAHGQLKQAYGPHPASLSFISDLLWDENRNLAKQIDEIMPKLGYKKFPQTNWIFMITDSRPRDPFKEIEKITQAQIVENLIVVSLHLPDLSNFVNEIFNECGAKHAKAVP